MQKWEADIVEERTAYEERVAPLLAQKERFEQGTQAPMMFFSFPQSVKEFNELSPAAKLRVAQFLQAPTARAEQMAAEQNWKYEVNKLKALYASDVSVLVLTIVRRVFFLLTHFDRRCSNRRSGLLCCRVGSQVVILGNGEYSWRHCCIVITCSLYYTTYLV